MDIKVFSTTHAAISDGMNVIHLEYDEASDFIEAIEAEPERAGEIARVAFYNAIGDAIEAAAHQVINARDCCGDERLAAFDALGDEGLFPSRAMVAEAISHADAQWRGYQNAAGVTKPISPEERVKINRDMEDAS